MKLTLGIVLSVMSLGACIAMVEDIKPNSTSIIARPRKSRAAVIAGASTVISAIRAFNDLTTLISGIDTLKNMVKPSDDDEQFRASVTRQLNEILELSTGLDQVRDKVSSLSYEVKESADRVINSVEFSHDKLVVEGFKKNDDFVNSFVENRFRSIQSEIEKYDDYVVDSHFREIVNSDELQRALSNMMSDITSSPSTRSSIFSAMSGYYSTKNGYKFRCEHISPLDDLHIFHGNVLMTFAQAYVMEFTSLQHLKTTANTTGESQYWQDRQNTASANFRLKVETLISHAKTDFDWLSDSNYRASYACDPENWEEGKSYIRVKNYVTGKVDYLVETNTDNSLKEITNPELYDCKGWASYSPVPGETKGTRTKVCPHPFFPGDENPYPQDYSEITIPYGRTDQLRVCHSGASDLLSDPCFRDRNSDTEFSIRKLSLKWHECDASINEVVTDAVFAEKNKVITMKLRCGVLNGGKIDPSTLRWVEDNEQYSLSEPSEVAVLSLKLRTFNIENVLVGHKEAVTAAKFEIVDNCISLKLRGHKVNNFNGATSLGEESFYSAPKPTKPRNNIDISRMERPIQTMSQTVENGTPGESSINLTISSWSDEYHNFAIIPYFDMSEFAANVENPDMTPLEGLGIFYKSVPSYAGFLAFKHLSPTYIQYVDADKILHDSIVKVVDNSKK